MANEIDYTKGFTRIPHKMMRRGLMHVNFSAQESRIFWTIYWWSSFQEASVSFEFSWNTTYRGLSKKVGMDYRNAVNVVKMLIDKNIVQASASKTELRKTNFSINMNIESWNVEFHLSKSKIRKQIEANLRINTPLDIQYYKGYCSLPNTMKDGLRHVNFSARESRIFWTIISKTVSFRQVQWHIAYRELATESALDIHDTHTTVQRLVDKNIIQTSPTKQKTKFVINQYGDSWQSDGNNGIAHRVSHTA